jgi:hypothetical protein
MPRIELLHPPSMAPPTVGSTCVCPSLFGLDVGPSCLHGRLEGGPSEHGTAGAFTGTLPILRWQCTLTLRVSRWHLVLLALCQSGDRLGPSGSVL